METIRGKVSRELHSNELAEQIAGYQDILLDLGTGDGRFVRTYAQQHAAWFAIGIDSCRENLHEQSRARVPNALFIIAGAPALPPELNGLASRITVNFPWGSLLRGLLADDPAFLDGLQAISHDVASIEIRVNAGAMIEAGTSLAAGAAQISNMLAASGWQVNAPAQLSSAALRSFPSTWARRLAFGRDPRALLISGALRR